MATRYIIKTYFKVKHLEGSSKYKPKDYDSWKSYWEGKSGKSFPKEKKKCPCCGSIVPPEHFVGSHVVRIDDSSKKYICPVCDSCNDKYGKNKEESPVFEVKRSNCVEFLVSEAEIQPL